MMRSNRRPGAFPVILFVICFGLMPRPPLHGEVVRIDVESRRPVLAGRPFGTAGSYEMLEGRVVFGFDPANPANARIVDLGRAPRGRDGRVEAVADLVVLKPVDPRKAGKTALVEVSNRGGKFSLRYFNRATARTLTPDDPAAFGTGLLMKRGYTVIWVGWQFDVPRREGILRLRVPHARHMDGTPIEGLVRCDWTVDRAADSLMLSHRDHIPYPTADPGGDRSVLTVREGREAPRRVIPGDFWSFARMEDGRVIPDLSHIALKTGFEAGKIYELVYPARDPAVAGLGLAAIRDIVSYAKYDEGSLFPVSRGIAAGVSQTGRFLRHFIYQGFNTDEKFRPAYDGLMIITAGAGRGSFNHRFAQPSRDAHRYSAFFYPTDIFPFTGRVTTDEKIGRSDGLQAHALHPGHRPRVFYVNTGYEYWGRAASLIHTSPDGRRDVEPLDFERIYHLASGQHFVGRLPREGGAADRIRVFPSDPLDFSFNYRALLVRLTEWVEGTGRPPGSRYPRLSDGTLVDIGDVAFPHLKGVEWPQTIHTAYRADYGPRWGNGIVDFQPPRLGDAYPTKVSQVDAYGNEEAGVRNVEIRTPLATYLPWNIRSGMPGGEHELTDFIGTFIPFPLTDEVKSAARDPRPAIASLYKGRKEYLEKARAAAADLAGEGFLLEEEVDDVVENAARIWDWIRNNMR